MRSSVISPTLVIEINPVAKPSTTFDWVSLGPTAVAAMVAVGGWIIVERFAKARERRAEQRELVKLFVAEVQAITALAMEFWELPGKEPKAQRLANAIRAQMQGLSSQLIVMKAAGLNGTHDAALKDFRMAVTGGDFDSKKRAAITGESSLPQEISTFAETLSADVRIGHFETYLSRRQRRARAKGRR